VTSGSFGDPDDRATEMPDESEAEAPPQETESASATGQADPAAAAQEAGTEAPVEDQGPVGPSAEVQLAERTADLQRLQAEYANYRKRVDRDRQLVAENSTYQALVPIVEVLDTIDRAREHAEVSGQPLDEGLQAVADQLERAVTGRGLSRFGQPGEAFDPSLHEALSHLGEDPEVQVTTVKQVVKAGYRIGDRVVRAAQVLVVDPA
jgi:molecular chaperone GrpE